MIFTRRSEENGNFMKFFTQKRPYLNNEAQAQKVNIIFVIIDLELVENHSNLDFLKFVKIHKLTPWVFFLEKFFCPIWMFEVSRREF